MFIIKCLRKHENLTKKSIKEMKEKDSHINEFNILS